MEIGRTLKKIRLNKVMTAKKLAHDITTPQHMSNIEREGQMLAADKFIMLLNRLNVTYDEFLFLLGDKYLLSKHKMEKNLSECVKRRNVDKLLELEGESLALFKEHDDVFFQHVSLMSRAMIELFQSNYNYESSRKHLRPIRDYLVELDAFSYYEIKLIGQCIFMFEIEEAISFGDRAINTIKKYHAFHKNNFDMCVLFTNMAIYTLDYKDYHHLALDYSQACINSAATNDNHLRALNAQIINQVSHFKIGDGLFDKPKLISLIDVFKLLNWHTEHKHVIQFVEKHGICLKTLSIISLIMKFTLEIVVIFNPIIKLT